MLRDYLFPELRARRMMSAVAVRVEVPEGTVVGGECGLIEIDHSDDHVFCEIAHCTREE